MKWRAHGLRSEGGGTWAVGRCVLCGWCRPNILKSGNLPSTLEKPDVWKHSSHLLGRLPAAEDGQGPALPDEAWAFQFPVPTHSQVSVISFVFYCPTTEDEMVGWHHRLNGHEFEQAPGVGDGQGSLACCSPWTCKESDTTEQLNWTELSYIQSPSHIPINDNWCHVVFKSIDS